MGDADALERAYRRHAGAVATVVRRLVADEGGVQDVVQETFLRAWRQRSSFDPDTAPLRAWMILLAHGAAVDHVRARAARPWHQRLIDPLSAYGSSLPPLAEDESERVLARWVLEEEINRLPAAQRTVIIETQLRDRPHAEVAADLGVPVGTVRSRLFHGLRAMRSSLERQELLP